MESTKQMEARWNSIKGCKYVASILILLFGCSLSFGSNKKEELYGANGLNDGMGIYIKGDSISWTTPRMFYSDYDSDIYIFDTYRYQMNGDTIVIIPNLTESRPPLTVHSAFPAVDSLVVYLDAPYKSVPYYYTVSRSPLFLASYEKYKARVFVSLTIPCNRLQGRIFSKADSSSVPIDDISMYISSLTFPLKNYIHVPEYIGPEEKSEPKKLIIYVDIPTIFSSMKFRRWNGKLIQYDWMGNAIDTLENMTGPKYLTLGPTLYLEDGTVLPCHKYIECEYREPDAREDSIAARISRRIPGAIH